MNIVFLFDIVDRHIVQIKIIPSTVLLYIILIVPVIKLQFMSYNFLIPPKKIVISWNLRKLFLHGLSNLALASNTVCERRDFEFNLSLCVFFPYSQTISY